MSRILVDLTEFKSWSGHFTGVQRVVYNIAANLESKQQVGFVNFDTIQDELVDDDLENYKDNPKNVTDQPPEIATTTRARGLAQTLYFKVPYKVRNRLTAEQKRQLKRLVRGAYHRSLKLREKLAQKSAKQTTKIIPRDHLNLEDGDTLIIGGRLWDYPAYIDYLIAKRKLINFKLVVIVYDLIPIYQQHTFGPGLTERFTKYLFEVLSHADVVLPISKSTASDVRRFAKETGFVKLPEIAVIRLGDDIEMAASETRPLWMNKQVGDFVIMVGTIEARKNHLLLYQAYKLAKERGVVLPHLFIIGKPGWLTGDILYIFQHDDEMRQAVTFQGNVTDGELNWMYKNASFSVYPSQYEGWGLPIAESLMHGVPCIASHASSMAEIAPGLVDYVSPFDSAQLLDKMVYLSGRVGNQKRRQEIKNGYKPTSWRQTAMQITHTIS